MTAEDRAVARVVHGRVAIAAYACRRCGSAQLCVGLTRHALTRSSITTCFAGRMARKAVGRVWLRVVPRNALTRCRRWASQHRVKFALGAVADQGAQASLACDVAPRSLTVSGVWIWYEALVTYA
jgi:hypothetical protein